MRKNEGFVLTDALAAVAVCSILSLIVCACVQSHSYGIGAIHTALQQQDDAYEDAMEKTEGCRIVCEETPDPSLGSS